MVLFHLICIIYFQSVRLASHEENCFRFRYAHSPYGISWLLCSKAEKVREAKRIQAREIYQKKRADRKPDYLKLV